MTTKRDPHRRQLAAHVNQATAQGSAFGEHGWLHDPNVSGVEVVERPRFPGDDRPWAITAAKPAT